MPFGRRLRKTAPARWINTRLEYGPSGKLINQEGYWYKGVVAEAGGAFKDGADWQFQSDGAEDATGNLLGTVNTNPAKGLLVNSTVYFLRFGVEETNGGGWMNAAPILQYNKNSGGWTTVNASSANIQTAAGTPVDGVDTSQLITGFTHDPTNEGYDDVDGQVGGPSADLGNSGFECVFAFQIIDGDVADDDTIELRPVDSALAALRVYPQSWPTITVQKAAADTIIDVPEGTFALAGQLPAVGTGTKVDAPEGTFALAGQVPAVGTGALVTLPSEQSFSLAGQVPTIETGVNVALPAEVTFSLAGQVPAVGTGVLVTLPSENSFSLAGQVPAVGTGAKMDVPEGTFALAGQVPEVASGAGGGGLPVLESFLSSNGGATASNTLILDKPSGVVSGDLLILICMNDSSVNNPEFTDNKSGWNYVDNSGNATSGCHIGMFWRIADGTEGASESVISALSRYWSGFYIRISGHNILPVDAELFSSSSETNPQVIGEITTTVDNCLVIYALSHDGGDGVPFSVSGAGWSETDEVTCGAGLSARNSGCFGVKEQNSAGLTGDASVTSNAGDGGAFFQIAIAPSAGGGVDIVVPEGTFALAGQVPTIETGVNIDVPEGTFSLTGYAPSVGGIFVAEGTFALAGQVPAVGTGTKMDAPEGTFAFGPQLPRVGTSALVDVPEGTFAFAGQVPAVGTSVDVQLLGEQAFVLTGQVPAVGTGAKVASPVNGFDLAGQIPEVDAGGAAEVLVPEGSFALAGQVPIINTGVNVEVPEQAYIFQGIDPTIAAGVEDDGHRRRVRTHWNE